MDELTKSAIGIVSGFVGAIAGAFVARWQARRQKGFERQLDWYEHQIAAMHDMAQAIEIACTFQRETADLPLLQKLWRDVQGRHLALDTLMNQAPLYASDAACKAVTKLEEVLDEAANETEAFDLAKTANEKLLELMDGLATSLRKRSRPLAKEARAHLGIR